MISREEVEEIVSEMFCGWVYEVLPKKLLKEVKRYIDFEGFEEHFVSEIMMSCCEEKGQENGHYEATVFETAGF